MALSDQLRASLVTAACVLALAIVSKYFIARELDFVSQYGPVWVYIAYVGTEENKKHSALLWSFVIVAATMGILVVYAL